MAGRKPIGVFVYDTQGKYICKFDNMTVFRSVYYPSDEFKRPLFRKKELGLAYELVQEAGVIAYQERVGRDITKQLLAIVNSEYCKDEDYLDSKRPVQVLNLKNEVIAEFKTVRLLTKMMPHIHANNISRHLTANTREEGRKNKRRRFTSIELFFKYKDEE